MVTRGSHRLALVALFALSLVNAAAADSRPKLSLNVPASAVGDGETNVVLTVRGATDENAVHVDVDAGTLGHSRVVSDGIEVDYVPPRVAQARDVHLRLLDATRVAPSTIALTPAPRALVASVHTGAMALTSAPFVVLGQEAATTITLLANTVPVLTTNVGKLDAPVADGVGRWRVTYTPPTQRFPQLAIIAAHDADGHFDWLTLPLYGVGRVETRTKARARIRLRFGEASFGPFRTDGSGIAVTPVIAPPGVHRGTTEAVDALGNAKQTPFDLGTPPFSRVLAVCTKDVIHVLVSDEHGLPSSLDDKLMLSVQNGALATTTRIAPGHYTTTWRPRDNEQAVTGEVQVALNGEPASQMRCIAQAALAEPNAIVLSIDRGTFVAGSGSLHVTAQLQYPVARGGRAVPIAFETDDGTIDASGTWQIPDVFGARTSATVRAHTTSTPSVSAEMTIPLVGAARATLHLAPAPKPQQTWITADGQSRVRVAVHAVDRFGNATSADGLVATAHDASVAVVIDGEHSAIIEYAAPIATRAIDERIVVVDSAAGVKNAIALRMHAPPRPMTLEARVGYLTNFGKISAPLVAVDAEWHPRWLRRRLALGVSAGFFRAAHSDGAVALTTLGVPLLARLGVVLARRRFGATLGIGGGALIARVATTSTVAGNDFHTAVLGAFEARLGGDVDVGVGRLTLEASYLYAPQSSGTITGNFGGLAATLGYRVGL